MNMEAFIMSLYSQTCRVLTKGYSPYPWKSLPLYTIIVFNAIYRVHGDLDQTLLIGAWMITVLLADDHTLVLNGLQFLLETAEDIQIVATASNGIEAVAQA